MNKNKVKYSKVLVMILGLFSLGIHASPGEIGADTTIQTVTDNRRGNGLYHLDPWRFVNLAQPEQHGRATHPHPGEIRDFPPLSDRLSGRSFQSKQAPLTLDTTRSTSAEAQHLTGGEHKSDSVAEEHKSNSVAEEHNSDSEGIADTAPVMQDMQGVDGLLGAAQYSIYDASDRPGSSELSEIYGGDWTAVLAFYMGSQKKDRKLKEAQHPVLPLNRSLVAAGQEIFGGGRALNSKNEKAFQQTVRAESSKENLEPGLDRFDGLASWYADSELK